MKWKAWLLAVSLLIAAIVAGGAVYISNRSTYTEPPPTSTPAAPGIVVVPMRSVDLPDPMIVDAGHRYYVYLSSAFADPKPQNVPMLSGSPGKWGPLTDVLPDPPAWAQAASAGGKSWDPYVQKIGREYLLYYSPQLAHPAMALNRGEPAVTHCLGVAESTDPSGPFVPVGAGPIVCQQNLGGDIDVQPFYDPAGFDGPKNPWYLVWKSDNNNLTAAAGALRSQTYIWAAPLANDGHSLTGPPRIIYQPDLAWQKPVLEAPQMVLAPNGSVWLFYSAGTGFYTAGYGMGVASCGGPLGVCRDFGTQPLITTNLQGQGPGEETVFIAKNHSYWLLYNPWHTGLRFIYARPAEGARIGWNQSGPYVAEAGKFPNP